MFQAPLDIRRFESLKILSVILGLISVFSATDEGLLDTTIETAVTLALTLGVSRGRKNWARWLLLVQFGIGAAIAISNVGLVLSVGYPLLTAAVWLISAVALGFAFTPESSRWLHANALKS